MTVFDKNDADELTVCVGKMITIPLAGRRLSVGT